MIALAARKESWIKDGQLTPDHVRMMIAVPRKYAVFRLPLNDFRGHKRDERNFDRNDRQTHRVFIAAGIVNALVVMEELGRDYRISPN